MGFIKRFLPFAAAFAVGIFVSSFFVDLRGPRFFRMDMNGHNRYRRQMRDRNALEQENYMLRRQLEEYRFSMPARPELPVPPPVPQIGEGSDNGIYEMPPVGEPIPAHRHTHRGR